MAEPKMCEQCNPPSTQDAKGETWQCKKCGQKWQLDRDNRSWWPVEWWDKRKDSVEKEAN